MLYIFTAIKKEKHSRFDYEKWRVCGRELEAMVALRLPWAFFRRRAEKRYAVFPG